MMNLLKQTSHSSSLQLLLQQQQLQKEQQLQHQLPLWIFEVDDEDEAVDENTSLLQELEIDLTHIYKSISWMVIGPWMRLCSRLPSERHPIHVSSSVTIDFWGMTMCSVCMCLFVCVCVCVSCFGLCVCLIVFICFFFFFLYTLFF